MAKVIQMPNGPWGNDAADWPGTADEWRGQMRLAEEQADVIEIADDSGAIPEAVSLLRPVSLADFTTVRAPAPEFVMDPFIPRGFVTLLGGHGEIGKSMLGLTLAAHVANGCPWADLPVRQGRVLYLSMEDAGEIAVFRLQRIADAYNLDAAELIANLSILDASEAGPLAQEVSEHGVRNLVPTPTAAEVEKLVGGFDLVVIDNASDAFDGDENNRRQVRAFIKGLARWVKGHAGAVLLLVHIDKAAARNGAQGNTYSGSTAWHNSARSRLALSRNEKEDTVELAHEKLNVGRKLAQPVCLEWSDSGVLLPISANARQSARALADAAHDQDVYHAVRSALAAGYVIPTATTGPNTASHVLSTFAELPTALKDRAGKAKLDAVLVRLHRQGLLHKETYRKDSKIREKWCLA